HVARIDQRDEQEEKNRQGGQDPAGHPALGGERSDGSTELEPLADRLGDTVEHLGCVAARLALERGHQRYLLELPAVHPLDYNVQRVVDRHAKLLVRDDTLKLGLRRFGSVIDDDREGADEAVPCAEGGREHVEVVGKLLGKEQSPLGEPAPEL